MALQPEEHVGLAAHGANINHLLQAKHVRGHTGVDGIGQFDVVLLIGLDDGGCVYASRRAERIFPHYCAIRQRNNLSAS